MTSRYIMKALPQVQEFFNEIAADMALSFSMPLAEAVARINQYWCCQAFLDAHDHNFHEDTHYWAMRIYFSEVPDWLIGLNGKYVLSLIQSSGPSLRRSCLRRGQPKGSLCAGDDLSSGAWP